MGDIIFGRCTGLKSVKGKPREFTIIMQGVDLTESQRLAMFHLEGKKVNVPKAIEEGHEVPEIAALVTEAIGSVSSQIERAFNLGVLSAPVKEENTAISTEDMSPEEVV